MLSGKENVLQLYRDKTSEYMPIFGEGIINNTPVNGYLERARGGNGRDWFGVRWVQQPGEPAPMPAAPYLLDDIADWKEVVHFPDLDAFDWEEAARLDRIPVFDRENQALYQMIHNGLVERLQNIMRFEDALCAMLEDPDSVAEFFDAMVDYKCRLIDKIAQYYHPDVICYHDDWGTQRGLIFSPDTWRDLVKEPTRRIVEHVHSRGMYFELHSDGLIESLVPEIAEDLGLDSINLQAINDVKSLKKETGDSVIYDMFLDIQKYEVLAESGTLSDNDFHEMLYEDVMRVAEGGHFIPTMILVRDSWKPIIQDVLHQVQKEV